MQPSDTPTILSALTAPALVCERNGSLVGMNTAAKHWLCLDGADAEQVTVSELLETPDENLLAFFERCMRHAHGVLEGTVYPRLDGSGTAAMSCHAQRLQGPDCIERLLLVLSHAPQSHVSSSVCGATVRAESDEAIENLHLTSATPPDRSDVQDEGVLDALALALVHEARQPLTAIATYASSCRRWLSAGRWEHPRLIPTLEKIVEQADATERMIDGLKGLVQTYDEASQTCDFNSLVGKSLDVLALDPRVDECTIEALPKSDICPVNVSPQQVQLVLINLLRNALEASLAGDRTDSRVRVSVASNNDWVSATVSDSGTGLTRTAKSRLFEPAVSEKSSGLGLGLAICRWLAIANAGRIDYEPGAPRGASFRLSFPIAR